jgi:UDP:flavonoid glycosyltransferase YjiC (YdhE family)
VATILFAWECGGGIGHLTRYKELIKRLTEEQQHKVIFSALMPERAEEVVEGLHVEIRPLPAKSKASKKVPARSYLDVLHNQGVLQSFPQKISRWKAFIEEVEPDILIIDHAPSVILVSHLFPDIVSIHSGNSFSLPVIGDAFIPYHPNIDLNNFKLRENRILNEIVNPTLMEYGHSGFERLSHAFQGEKKWLHNIPTFDLQASQRSDTFMGFEKPSGKEKPSWPDTKGPKVFAYLKPHPLLTKTLKHFLENKNASIIIYGQNITTELGELLEHPSLVMAKEPVDFPSFKNECDLALTNGNIATTASLISLGIPVLMLPGHIDQGLTAQAIEKKGVGILLTMREPEPSFLAKINQSLSKEIKEKTQALAKEINPLPRPLEKMSAEIDEILSNKA